MRTNPAIVILGIDPGTLVTGYGVVSQNGTQLQRLCSGAIQSKKTAPLEKRLMTMYEGLAGVIHEFKPTYAAVESVFAHKNVRSAVTLAHARGVALLACANYGVDVTEYSPMQVKLSAVGYGNATKDQVASMMRRLFTIPASETKTKSDPFDALAVAFCHLQHHATRHRMFK